MFKEGAREPDEEDISGWGSVTWCGNVTESKVWTDGHTFAEFYHGTWQDMNPQAIKVRSFSPEGLFSVGVERMATPGFRRRLSASMLGFECLMRGISGEDFRHSTRGLREELEEQSGPSRGASEAMLWWKVNSGLGEYIHMLRRGTPEEIRRRYPTLPLGPEGCTKVKGPYITAALLVMVLKKVSLTACLPNSPEAQRFDSQCWPLISFKGVEGKGETPIRTIKTEPSAYTAPTTGATQPSAQKSAMVGGGSGKDNRSICIQDLKWKLGERTDANGKKTTSCPHLANACHKRHVTKGSDTKSDILAALQHSFFNANTEKGRRLQGLVSSKW